MIAATRSVCRCLRWPGTTRPTCMPGSTAHSTLHSGRLGICEPLSTLGRLCWLLLLPGWLLVLGAFAVGPSAAPHKIVAGRHSGSRQQNLPGPFHLQNSLVRFLTVFLWASSSIEPRTTAPQRVLCCGGGLLAAPVQGRRILPPWGLWLYIALLCQLLTCIGRGSLRCCRTRQICCCSALLSAALRIANALRPYGLCNIECN